MKWYQKTLFYHIYPLGLSGAPFYNENEEVVHRLNDLIPWIDHIKELGFTGLYIGPLFKSMSHGYDTSDYYLLDNRLGDNDDLKNFVRICHEKNIRVIFDAVFNHTGRDFFAFQDIKTYRETSWKLDWYKINFHNNNEFDDGFSYSNWGGHNSLVKLNLDNPEVRNYLLDVVRFWVNEFEIDGLRLDAADVLNFEFMKELRALANNIKQDFWLMGEVIHGEYGRWANDETLHSVTNYHLHKALYSSHNDHNYFELAHTIKRQFDMGLNRIDLYNFVDNHDVERIINKLKNRNNFYPVHILLFTLPGIPSIYYGSEYGIEGKKQRGSDVSLRPHLILNELNDNDYLNFIKKLADIYNNEESLWDNNYQELQLATTKYCFKRNDLIIVVNNDDNPCDFNIHIDGKYIGLINGKEIESIDNNLHIELDSNTGEIYKKI